MGWQRQNYKEVIYDKDIPLLILVNGAASTGKTTIARIISKKYSIAYYSKDDFRNILVNVLGSGNLGWVKICGRASAEIFRLIIERSISNKSSVIIDQIFFDEIISPFIDGLRIKYEFYLIQVFCKCNPDVALKRYVERSKSGERNPGFKEELTYHEVQKRQREWEPADVGGSLVIIDTTETSTISKQLKEVYKIIDNFI